MNMKTKITLMLLLIGSFSFAQINIKTPDLEKKAKEKLEKSKDKKEKDAKDKIEKEKKDKKDKVEDKIDEKTDLDKKTSGGDKDVKTIVASTQYAETKTPKVTEPILYFYSDPLFENKLDVVVPGATDVFARVIFPKPLEEIFTDVKGRLDKFALKFTFNDDKGEEVIHLYQYPSIYFRDFKEVREFSFLLHGNGSSQDYKYSSSGAFGGFNNDDDEIETTTKKMIPMVDDRSKMVKANIESMFNVYLGHKLINYAFGHKDMNFGSKLEKMPNKVNAIQFEMGFLKGEDEINSIYSGTFNYDVRAELRPQMTKYKPDAKKYERIKDDGISTELHKNNINKVLFSSSKLDKKSNDPSVLKKSFKLNEPIYAIMYMKESIGNSVAHEGKTTVRKDMETRIYYSIDGKEFTNTPGMHEIDYQKETSFPIKFGNNSEGTSGFMNSERYFAYVISQIPAGKHTVKVTIKPSIHIWKNLSPDPQPIWAEGEFEVNFTEAERDEFVKKNGQLFEELTNISTDQGFNTLAKSKVPGAIRYSISEPVVQRNSFGVITHRVGYMRTIEKNKEGDFDIVNYSLSQNFVGGKWENKMSSSETLKYLQNIAKQNHK